MKSIPGTRYPRRVVVIVAAALVVVAAASLFWVRGADERRVNAACGTWLENRESLRTALSESDEAVGRARGAGAGGTKDYFNDFDCTSAALRQWLADSPRVIGALDGSSGASDLERGSVSAFEHVQSGIVELQQLIDHGKPTEVSTWIPEMDARLQGVDDVCLTAARSSWPMALRGARLMQRVRVRSCPDPRGHGLGHALDSRSLKVCSPRTTPARTPASA